MVSMAFSFLPQILEEVGDNCVDVVLFADGSWKMVTENNEKKNEQLGVRNPTETGSQVQTDIVDLTMEEDNESVFPMNSTQVESLEERSTNPFENANFEMEDRKPFLDYQNQNFLISELFSELPITSATSVTTQTAENNWSRSNNVSSTTIAPGGLVSPLNASNPNDFDAVSNPVTNDAILQSTFPLLSSQGRQITENLQLQPSSYGNSLVSTESGRAPIPRNVTRAPIAVQALPVPSPQSPSASRRMRTNNVPNNFTSGMSTSYPAVHLTATPNGIAVGRDMEIEQLTRSRNAVNSSVQLQSTPQVNFTSESLESNFILIAILDAI